MFHEWSLRAIDMFKSAKEKYIFLSSKKVNSNFIKALVELNFRDFWVCNAKVFFSVDAC